MKGLFLIIWMITAIAFTTQAQGIIFQDITLSEALTKAKEENKLVFVDCFTAWSAPCKQMAEKVFTVQNVGLFFNTKFLNLKIDMEKGEGPELAKRYGVTAYPTFLLITPEGKLQQKGSGVFTPELLMQWAGNGMTYETSTSWFDDQYAAGMREPEFVSNYLMILQTVCKDNGRARDVAKDYLSTLSPEEKTSSKGWIVFGNGALAPVGSEEFTFLLINRSTFEQQLTKAVVDQCLEKRFDEAIVPYLTGQVLQKIKPEEAVTALMSLQTDMVRLLPGNSVLNLKINMAKARCTGKVPELLDLLEDNYEVLNSTNDISVIYFYCLAPVLERITLEQRARVFAVGQKTLTLITDSGFKSYFGQIMQGLERRLENK